MQLVTKNKNMKGNKNMDIEFQEFLNKDIGYGNTLKNKKMKLLNEIKESIKKDKQFLEQATDIDFKKWKKKIDFDIFSNIIDEYIETEKKNHTAMLEEGNSQIEKIVISYYGNPYVTFILCIQAIINQKQLLLEAGKFMLSTNTFIINMINQILQENHLPKLLTHCIEIVEEKSIIEKEIKTIIIGATQNKAKYLGKYIYIPYNNYIIYCVDEELEELSNSIYDYAFNNFFEAEVLFEEDIEEAIEIINLKKDCIAVILTKDINLQNLFKERIQNKLYINENPFVKEEINIPVDCLETKREK